MFIVLRGTTSINKKTYSSSEVRKPLFSNPRSTCDPRGKLPGLVKSSQLQASSLSFARKSVGKNTKQVWHASGEQRSREQRGEFCDFAYHARTLRTCHSPVLRSSLLSSLKIFAQKSDCSQSRSSNGKKFDCNVREKLFLFLPWLWWTISNWFCDNLLLKFFHWITQLSLNAFSSH